MCLDYYERLDRNPCYEIGLSFGPYLAAMVNAEKRTSYDPTRYIDWMIEGSSVRKGYGVAEGNYNSYNVYGLIGRPPGRRRLGLRLRPRDLHQRLSRARRQV